jgi:hypothetical protein
LETKRNDSKAEESMNPSPEKEELTEEIPEQPVKKPLLGEIEVRQVR